MRNLIVSLAAAASALAVASPAAAQWAPQQPYGYGYGHDDRGQVRALMTKVERVRSMIHRFDRSNRISNREARRLDRHAIELGRRVHQAAYRGLNYRERQDIEFRVHSLREAVRYSARENRRWGWNGQTGHSAYANTFGYYGQRLRDDDRRGDRNDDRRSDRFDDDHDDDGDRRWN